MIASNKERIANIKALKQRFKILDPNKIPSWVSIEAAAIFEDELQWRLEINKDGEVCYKYNPKSESEASRTSLKYYACKYLCESLEMKYAWEKANAFFENNPNKGQLWFSKCLLNSLIDPNERIETNREIKSRKNAIIKHLEAVVSLTEEATGTLLQAWADENFQANKRISQGAYEYNMINKYPDRNLPTKTDRRNIRPFFPPFEIQVLIDSLKNSNPPRGIYGRQTNGEKAPRLLFIRSLTCALLQETGKPYRKVVVQAASTAFQCSLSTPEIIKATSSLNPSVEQKIVGGLDMWRIEELKVKDLLKNPELPFFLTPP